MTGKNALITICSVLCMQPSFLSALTPDWTVSLTSGGGARQLALDTAGNIYAGVESANGYLVSLSPVGTENWSVLLDDANTGNFTHVRGVAVDRVRGRVYTTFAGANGGRLDAYDLGGVLQWSFSGIGGAGILSSPVIGWDGTIYAGASGNNNSVYAFFPDGTLKWTYALPSGSSVDTGGIVILSSGDLVVGTRGANAEVYCLNAAGQLKWVYALNAPYVFNLAIDSQDNIYVSQDRASTSSNLIKLDRDGNLAWTFAAGAGLMGVAIDVDGTIYAGSRDHFLYAVNPNGSTKWTYDSGLALGMPSVGEAGSIYVASIEGSGANSLLVISSTGQLLDQAALGNGRCGWDTYSPMLTETGKLYIGMCGANQFAAFTVADQGLAASAWPRSHADTYNTGRAAVSAIAHWTFDEGSGLTAVDVSGNGHDGAITGAEWTTGKVGGALYFNAADQQDVVTAPHSADFDFSAAQDFTVEAWIQPDTPSSYRGIVGRHDDRAWMLSYRGTASYPNDFRFEAIGSGGDNNYPAETSAPLGEWTHVAVVVDRSAGELRMYKDGALTNTHVAPNYNLSSSDPLHIGWHGFNISDRWFGGKIDEVRIVGAALMPEQFIGYPFVEISFPNLTSFYAQPFSAPIQVSGTGDQGIVSAELFVAYDGDLLTPFSSPVSSTTMTSVWTIETNVVEGNGTPIDTLKIAMADEVALSGSGDLLILGFDVADIRVPYTSPLELVHVLFNDGTPQVAATDGSVKLIGTTGTTGVTPISATIIPRETITININDIDENTDSGSVQQFDVTVVNGAQVETLTLLEQGNDTDLFSATINTVFSLASTGAASSGDGIIQAKAGDEISFLYDDQLLGNGDGPVELHQEVVVTGGTDGTLRTTVVVQPGDTVRVKVVDADLSGSVNVRVDNPRSGDLEWLVLPEFSPGSSTFYGRFFTDEGAEIFGDSTLSILDCDTLLISYYDDVTALGDSTTLVSQTNGVVPFGDADDNGNVQAFDAALVLLHVLSPHLALWDSLSVNVDLQAPFGPITPYDASLILQHRVGLIDRFPVQTPLADNQPQPETSLQPGPKLVPETRRLSLRAGADYLSVWAEDRAGILSGDMLINGIEGKVQAGEELGGFLVESRATDEGLRIVFAGAEAVSGPGELLRVYGASTERAQLASASFNDGSITTQLENGPMLAMPTTYALYANVPNPFNPQTVIAFDLAQDSPVQLVVYDVLGQQVRSLVSGFLPAGSQRVLWDGRDQRGSQVGSGVYFYRLAAGEFVQTRRMMLLK